MKAAIIGGTGYGSIELVRLMKKHPHIEIGTVVSNSHAGAKFSENYPQLSNIVDPILEAFNPDRICQENDLVFFATPSGVSSKLVPPLLDRGIKCIDLSGDFRLRSSEEYESWYKHTPVSEDYLNHAIYGLSEIYAEKIKTANLIANPGCYPTAAALGLIPILKSNLADLNTIIIDAKSGVSGAGRGLSLTSHYAEINENLKAYKLGAHQHIPEIEQTFQDETGHPITITFTTHLVPMTRGIMCTMYLSLNENVTTDEIQQIYSEFYKYKPFVRVRSQGAFPATKEVLGSNYCDIGLHFDARTNRLTVISVIDNLVKGAAGQAIQNVNIMNGWDEQTGLEFIPMYP
ncbi:N-acetyl-gamma-glutamyl-phosphate reductase [Neobacillus vireti]|uniref:N-acetyl-gamma-glutamyl-phosphate reductase n=1 Tax=Neobacillus vireti LMG 21834 TaxID=1131730 RepID=A0AB94IIM6_9BACI|nr:N-acetyl-gamma-glutamyl-phosphate reductase [Neobacillus vireti]ETI66880.1 N-acetyl-gamma-glutamyl-phosphate reductase [Neobacillus vireti LMG 21834]KLT15224.1 N-acetyl-gamma-glutamyl-phosphate reductase [Neobacillus vireti]